MSGHDWAGAVPGVSSESHQFDMPRDFDACVLHTGSFLSGDRQILKRRAGEHMLGVKTLQLRGPFRLASKVSSLMSRPRN